MMLEKDAKAFITQVATLGTMDYSLLHKRPPIIKTNYGFSLPVPPHNIRDRDSGDNFVSSWNSTWLLLVSNGENL